MNLQLQTFVNLYSSTRMSRAPQRGHAICCMITLLTSRQIQLDDPITLTRKVIRTALDEPYLSFDFCWILMKYEFLFLYDSAILVSKIY
jgi:hypothetical protein